MNREDRYHTTSWDAGEVRRQGRPELADKGRGHNGDDPVPLLDGLDKLEDLPLVRDGAKGAAHQAHPAGDALFLVDGGLAVGVGADGVHPAGGGAGPLQLDDGPVGAGGCTWWYRSPTGRPGGR